VPTFTTIASTMPCNKSPSKARRKSGWADGEIGARNSMTDLALDFFAVFLPRPRLGVGATSVPR
jgi:hypothetical protein